jgi:hypothetical protein
VNTELRIWKEAVEAKFEAVCRYSIEEAAGNDKEPHSRQPVSERRSERRTY